MFPAPVRSDTFAIFGGGPSLKGVDLSAVPGHWTKIAVNNAYQIVPHADILFFADARWYELHRPKLIRDWLGRMVSPCSDHPKVPATEVTKIAREYKADFGEFTGVYNARDPKSCKVAGRDSGTMAVNFAAHCGARNIVLFGLDMTWTADESHWHKDHPWPTTRQRYEDTFAPILSRMTAELGKRGIKVWRATEPGLPEIPFRPIAELANCDISCDIESPV